MTAQSEIGRADFVTDVAACAGCRRRGDGVATKPASLCLLIVVDRECGKTIFTLLQTSRHIRVYQLRVPRADRAVSGISFFSRSLTWSGNVSFDHHGSDSLPGAQRCQGKRFGDILTTCPTQRSWRCMTMHSIDWTFALRRRSECVTLCHQTQFSPYNSPIPRGVSGCSSLGWPAGWPDLYLGGGRISNDIIHDWVNGVYNLTPHMRCLHAVLCSLTLLPCNQFH